MNNKQDNENKTSNLKVTSTVMLDGEWFDIYDSDIKAIVQYLGRKDIFVIGWIGNIADYEEVEREIQLDDSQWIFTDGMGEYMIRVNPQSDVGEYGEYYTWTELEKISFRKYE